MFYHHLAEVTNKLVVVDATATTQEVLPIRIQLIEVFFLYWLASVLAHFQVTIPATANTSQTDKSWGDQRLVFSVVSSQVSLWSPLFTVSDDGVLTPHAEPLELLVQHRRTTQRRSQST